MSVPQSYSPHSKHSEPRVARSIITGSPRSQRCLRPSLVGPPLPWWLWPQRAPRDLSSCRLVRRLLLWTAVLPSSKPPAVTAALALPASLPATAAHSQDTCSVTAGLGGPHRPLHCLGVHPARAHLCSTSQAGGHPCWCDCRGDADGGGGGARRPRQPGFRGQGEGPGARAADSWAQPQVGVLGAANLPLQLRGSEETAWDSAISPTPSLRWQNFPHQLPSSSEDARASRESLPPLTHPSGLMSSGPSETVNGQQDLSELQ